MSFQISSFEISQSLLKSSLCDIIHNILIQVTTCERYNSQSWIVFFLNTNIFSKSSSETVADSTNRVKLLALISFSKISEYLNFWCRLIICHKNKSNFLLSEDSIGCILIKFLNIRISMFFKESLHLFSFERFIAEQEFMSFIKSSKNNHSIFLCDFMFLSMSIISCMSEHNVIITSCERLICF